MRLATLLTAALLLILAAPHDAAAQAGTVTGTVLDAGTDNPLPSATVALHSAADSALVTGALAGADGGFVLENVPPGDYYVRVSFVGFEPEIVPDVAAAGGAAVDVGTVRLATDTATLEEVQVSAEREYMEIGVDRTVYNTQDQPVTAGGTAQDVLENIPSVEIDIDGTISLRGSQGVTVYLNGKPAPMTGDALTSFLAGLASEDIERVEVIPNPSARYEPEGTSGILNIVLAQDVDRGWGGSVNGNVNTRGRYGGSVSTNYGRGPWSLFSNYSVRYSAWDQEGWRYRENRYLDPLTILEQDFEGDRSGLSHNVNTSVDYAFDDRTTLSFSGLLFRRGNDGERLTDYEERDADGLLTGRYSRTTLGDDTDFSMDYRASFKHVITPREEELSVDVRFESERESAFEEFTERVFALEPVDPAGVLANRQLVDESALEREASAEVFYMRPLGETARLELGYEAEQEWVDEDFYSETRTADGVFAPDDDLNNTFVYSEQTHSAFGILGGRLGAFGAQVGLRLERALTRFDLVTTDEQFANDYVSVYPSAHLSYELTPTNTFKIAYSKRVRRPSEWQLNPFGDYDDPTSIRVGNPYLTPEYTHSGEISYSRLGERYTISLSPYLRYTVDEISWYERITDEGVTVLTFENFDTEQSYGAELVGSLTLGDWLKANGSINAYKQVTQAGSVSSELANDALGFRSRVSATAELRDGLRLQLSQFYRSPMDIPGGRIAAQTRTNLALQQQVLDGRGSLNLRVRDILGTPDELIRRDMDRYYQEYYQANNSRSVQVSFRYTFAQRGGGDDNDRRGDRRDWRGRR